MGRSPQAEIDNSQAPDTAAGSVEESRLNEDSLLLGQFVVVLDFDGDRLVAVDARQLHVGRVRHVEVAVEVRGSHSGGGSHSHHGVEAYRSADVVDNVRNQSLAVNVRLEVGVLVDLAAGEATHLAYGRDVNVGVVDDEKVHAAAGGHAVLAQGVVDVVLRGEDSFLLLRAE